jgi:hypothetical protein
MRLAEEGAVYLVPVQPNLVRQAKRESGLSGRQWRKLRKTQRRASRAVPAAAFAKTGDVSTDGLIIQP